MSKQTNNKIEESQQKLSTSPNFLSYITTQNPQTYIPNNMNNNRMFQSKTTMFRPLSNSTAYSPPNQSISPNQNHIDQVPFVFSNPDQNQFANSNPLYQSALDNFRSLNLDPSKQNSIKKENREQYNYEANPTKSPKHTIFQPPSPIDLLIDDKEETNPQNNLQENLQKTQNNQNLPNNSMNQMNSFNQNGFNPNETNIYPQRNGIDKTSQEKQQYNFQSPDFLLQRNTKFNFDPNQFPKLPQNFMSLSLDQNKYNNNLNINRTPYGVSNAYVNPNFPKYSSFEFEMLQFDRQNYPYFQQNQQNNQQNNLPEENIDDYNPRMRSGHRRALSYDPPHSYSNFQNTMNVYPNYQINQQQYYKQQEMGNEPVNRMYLISRDQQQCRLLQKQIEETKDKQLITAVLGGIYPYLSELIIDPYASHLCQKVMEYCTTEESLMLIHKIAPDLSTISVDMYGTRAIQKLIDSLTTPQQIDYFVNAISPHIADLANNPNGNHVIQKCLTKFTSESNAPIFQEVANNCIHISKTQARLLRNAEMYDFSSGIQKITINFINCRKFSELMQDPFANYVIQYILDLDSMPIEFVEKVRDNIFDLSMQKFSSNVVEKCLRSKNTQMKDELLNELIRNQDKISQLLTDPYGNYVVQTALKVAEKEKHKQLSEVIKPHLQLVRNLPYGKKIQNMIFPNNDKNRNGNTPTHSRNNSFGHRRKKSGSQRK
ncbi:pumilio domain-containing protein [Anaeramoeba ignava]|uniref:Pumilio domain-containing protein n=1 Tax=Anaeramoeba ignava TaxID=1746090 RepID=A0A9Q0L8N2_ANAIG|nr:pumilio domain-containing protein [Anaeramoeba ignava]